MLITELISQLEALKQEHGDLPVYLNREYERNINDVYAEAKTYYAINGKQYEEPLAAWIE